MSLGDRHESNASAIETTRTICCDVLQYVSSSALLHDSTGTHIAASRLRHFAARELYPAGRSLV